MPKKIPVKAASEKPKGARGRAAVRRLGRTHKTGGFEKISKEAAKRYGSKEAGDRVAGKIYQEMVHKHAASMSESLAALMVTAEEEEGDKSGIEGLKVLVDEGGHRLAQKIYKDLVSPDDFSKFPSFMRDLDKLIYKYRGDKPVSDEEVEDFAEDVEDAVDGKEGNNEKDKKKDDDEEEDEDLTGMEEAKMIEASVAEFLITKEKKKSK